jgi:hypothetical protein
MPRYYFDTRDGADFIRDEIGLELDGLEAARDEATRGTLQETPFPVRFGGSSRSNAATNATTMC